MSWHQDNGWLYFPPPIGGPYGRWVWIPGKWYWVDDGVVPPTITPPPHAAFDYYEFANGMVQFQNKSSNSPTSFAWSFGDGATSNLSVPAHIYSAAGTYNVTLTVSNAGGSSTWSSQIEVRYYATSVAFEISGGLSASFAYRGNILAASYLWTFGDGTTSSDPRPVHRYSAMSTYETSLVVVEKLTGQAFAVNKQLTIRAGSGLAFVTDHDDAMDYNDMFVVSGGIKAIKNPSGGISLYDANSNFLRTVYDGVSISSYIFAMRDNLLCFSIYDDAYFLICCTLQGTEIFRVNTDPMGMTSIFMTENGIYTSATRQENEAEVQMFNKYDASGSLLWSIDSEISPDYYFNGNFYRGLNLNVYIYDMDGISLEVVTLEAPEGAYIQSIAVNSDGIFIMVRFSQSYGEIRRYDFNFDQHETIDMHNHSGRGGALPLHLTADDGVLFASLDMVLV